MQPLAERMRPTKLQDLIGQEHLTGNGKVLNTAMVTKHIPSMIFWGPPGVGKTSLAKIIAQDLERPFHILSAVQSGVKEVREVLEKAKNQRFFDQASPILFIDEIHRFNKTQQDALLAAVEHGTIVLIGATTENPSFEVNAALLSRCQVYVLKPLQKEALLKLTNQILAKDFLFQNKKITLDETEGLIQLANGDARKLCNILELIGSQNSDEIHITDALVFQLVQENPAIYDKNGEMHYDMASAFIKSIRGSDPNATLYWMARMIDGGEDPRFIVRRMFISAAEDIGLANPNALLMVSACQNAVQMVGWPESRIILSEAAIYLACSPKSNSAYTAIEKALEQTKKSGNQAVPLHLRNAVTGLMKNMDYGKDYQYAHEHEHSFVDLEYLPEALRAQKFYEPGKNQSEDKIRAILKQFWKEKYNY
ncbi:MAG: replication-associated recombination protein A [Saprospiraceae bacterium]|nr:replication-associated recombination protein A [Saprospiraceae bacterium]MBK9728116.1 replication-associated recombination protein A [Saprospiraceae bacterium]